MFDYVFLRTSIVAFADVFTIYPQHPEVFWVKLHNNLDDQLLISNRIGLAPRDLWYRHSELIIPQSLIWKYQIEEIPEEEIDPDIANYLLEKSNRLIVPENYKVTLICRTQYKPYLEAQQINLPVLRRWYPTSEWTLFSEPGEIAWAHWRTKVSQNTKLYEKLPPNVFIALEGISEREQNNLLYQFGETYNV